MPVAKLIAPTTKQEIPKLRVAAYCRVSSNSADQRNSFATQEHVYTKYIAEKQEWELVDIFADEGLSGMKADNRPEFQRMIRMCELRQIDLILTKSVSRFARNVKEALNYTRKLKLLGVGVQFEEEGINTLAMADEMLLNTFAAIAQEESKSISQNQRLSIVKRMESGEYIASNAPYGYRLIGKKLVIYEPEAEVIRWIYRAYLNGLSIGGIARELTTMGVATKSGQNCWKGSIIAYILRNERYNGDSLFQKCYGENDVPFKERRNHGERDQFFAKNTHQAIVESDVFDSVQVLLRKRRNQFKREGTQNRYPLTCRIFSTVSLTLEMISASWSSPRDCAAIFIMNIRSLLEVSFICSERCLRKRRTKMELVTIEVKLPKEVYDSASEIRAKQGLTMEDALILFLKETVRLGRIPFDYTEADLEEARRWERIVNDDVQNTGGEETCMVN